MGIYFGKMKTNHHGTNAPGTPWNQETVHGFTLAWVNLEGNNIVGKRLIIYFPSGAWWHLDFQCKTRKRKKEERKMRECPNSERFGPEWWCKITGVLCVRESGKSCDGNPQKEVSDVRSEGNESSEES